MTKKFNDKQITFITAAIGSEFDVSDVDRHDLQSIADLAGTSFPQWLTTSPAYKVSRGHYRVPALDEDPADKTVWGSKGVKAPKAVKAPKKDRSIKAVNARIAENANASAVEYYADKPDTVPNSVLGSAPVPPVAVEQVVVSLTKGSTEYTNIPDKVDTYVPFGHFKDVFAIVKSEQFFPIFITGLSGNGKTMMAEQVCAKAKRELFRVNITIETDEDDLLGGFRLVNGETVWFDGPVVEAMKMGAVLLLDEVDLGSTKLMCLQPVLEGKGVFLKKVNEWVKPAKGFTIMATANTKGKGDETGHFIGAGVLNEAFLERFPITVEQEYASPAVEKKIVKAEFGRLGFDDDDFANKLVDWADLIRTAYAEDSVDDLITTRRLVHIAEAYAIFDDRMKAIEMCVARFDDLTKEVFLDTYTKLDADVELPTGDASVESADATVDAEGNACPF
tara:strand:+ start:3280 stop:4623 length:1344 start_codon:yes stop_codon:yes gene_type:complete